MVREDLKGLKLSNPLHLATVASGSGLAKKALSTLATRGAVPFSWPRVFVGCILFRFFDIVKPYPICWFDKKEQGGLGIMIDDIVAGIFAAMVLQFLIYYYG